MKHAGPLFTLLAGVTLAAGIGIANAAEGPGQPAAAQLKNVAAPAAPTSSAPPVSTAPTTSTPPPATGTSAPAPESSAPPATPAGDAPARGNYTGKVDEQEASVAVTVRDGHAIAYVCDGKKIEAWLQGSTTGGKLDLRDARGSRLIATAGAKSVTGTVVTGGKTWNFTAALAAKPAGLYRAAAKVRGKAAKVGWIVQPDGSQVGILTTDDGPASAPMLTPAGSAVAGDGTPITAEAIDGLAGEGDF